MESFMLYDKDQGFSETVCFSEQGTTYFKISLNSVSIDQKTRIPEGRGL